MQWYHSGYAIKEEKDKWSRFNHDLEKTLDLSEQGKVKLLEEHFGPIVDPTCPFNKARKPKNGKESASTAGTLLQWLDDGKQMASMTNHLIKTLEPKDTEKAKKALSSVLGQINLHLRKQGDQLTDAKRMVEQLRHKVALYEGDPSATSQCTLKQLVETEKKIHDASRKLKAEIEAFYAKSLTFPNEFLCPLTHEVFQDPVITKDGHTYERKAITIWFQSHATSPMTNMVALHSTKL
uniref:U-box domain-containing protein n=2 Tax=Lotharella globosa TaxID=91324 RepID=A0A7S4DHB5_9EUKA